jgi:single-strand DNA-binding protein
MRGLYNVTSIGTGGEDPAVQVLSDTISVAKFTLATTAIYKNSNGQKHSTTEWHNVIVWRNWTELAANYLKKGRLIYQEGKSKPLARRIKQEKGDWFLKL